MQKSCHGFANSAKNLLVVMDVMLRNGIKIVGVTDAGRTTPLDQERFNVFGIADDKSQITATAKEVGIIARDL